SEREYSTAFTLRFLLGILMLGIIVATSGFAARLLNNAAAGPVIKILSLNFIIASFGFIPGMQLTRALDYRRQMFPTISAAVAGSLVAIGLAFNGYGYWSLVFAELTSSAVRSALLHRLSRWRIKLALNIKSALELLQFGLPVFGSAMLVFIIFNADNFIIGAV